MKRYYFEDFSAGDRWEFGTFSLTEDEIIDFARQYDPLPTHIDREAAIEGPFGGLIASGWQTTMGCIRFFAEKLMAETAAISSPGLEEIKWIRAVRPGDVITASAEVTAVEPSKTKLDRGRVYFRFAGHNQDGEAVMSCHGPFFIERRQQG